MVEFLPATREAWVQFLAHAATASPWDFLCSSVGNESACSEETWVRFLGQEDALEKGMATHFNILAGRIPWTV